MANMNTSCAVLGCKRSSAGITCQTFPKDPDLRKEWIKATGRKNWVPLENSVICLAHFDGGQIVFNNNQLRLARDAIPKLSLPVEEIIVTTLSKDSHIATGQSMVPELLREKIKKQEVTLAQQRGKIRLLQKKLNVSVKKINSIQKLLEPIQDKLCTLKNVNLQFQDILLKQIMKDSKEKNVKAEM